MGRHTCNVTRLVIELKTSRHTKWRPPSPASHTMHSYTGLPAATTTTMTTMNGRWDSSATLALVVTRGVYLVYI